MKLFLLVCVCALAAAEPPNVAPSPSQLTGILTNLYRRFLHDAHPKQLKLQDALDIHWRDGKVSGPRHVSPVTATFEGIDYPNPTYSYVNGLITPGQKGYFGNWTKHDNSDLAMVYHYGGPVKVHMLTYGGIHKTETLGNPLYHGKEAHFVVLIPKNTYCTFESLSEEESTFNSYFAVPAWDPAHAHNYSNKEMNTKFPAFSELFKDLSSPEVHHVEDHHAEDETLYDERDFFYFGRPSRFYRKRQGKF